MSDGTSGVSKGPAKTKPAFHFAAGLLGGLTSSVLLQPADLLKTRLQQSDHAGSLVTTVRAILAAPNPVRNLWRGTLPSALRTGFGSALYFSSLNTLRQSVALVKAQTHAPDHPHASVLRTSALPKLSHTANLVTGAVARVSAGFVMMPVTVLKVRYESDYYAYRSLWGAGSHIVRTEGLKGLFSGFGATAIRDAPYAGLYVVFYEQCKRSLAALLRPAAQDGAANPPQLQSAASIHFLSGALAAGLATTITNPFDVIKTRVQLMPAKYRNMWYAAKLVLAGEGVRGLFGGLSLRIGRKAISSALAWTIYEDLILRAEASRWAQGEKSVLS